MLRPYVTNIMIAGDEYIVLEKYLLQFSSVCFCQNFYMIIFYLSLLVNFSHELVQIMTTYDFLSGKQSILSNVRSDFNLTQFLFYINWVK